MLIPPISFILLSLLAAVLIWYGTRKSKNENKVIKLDENPNLSGNGLITVSGMDEDTLRNSIADFISIYDLEEKDRPKPQLIGEMWHLKMPQNSDLLTMCFWVNFLVYCDENRKKRYDAKGWYSMGEAYIDGKAVDFCNQTVMVFVPEDDKEFDTAYIVTRNGKVYKQQFGGDFSNVESCHQKFIDRPL